MLYLFLVVCGRQRYPAKSKLAKMLAAYFPVRSRRSPVALPVGDKSHDSLKGPCEVFQLHLTASASHI